MSLDYVTFWRTLPAPIGRTDNQVLVPQGKTMDMAIDEYLKEHALTLGYGLNHITPKDDYAIISINKKLTNKK
jgi:hypothetical protein